MVATKKILKKSPMYPAVGLQNAIAKVKILYDKEGRNFIPKKLAATAMGYKSKSLTGSALQLLASLYQYGLIVRKSGEVKISDDAFTILNAPDNSPDKIEALTKCGSNPKIFNDLYAKYSDKLPSNETVIWYLQQQNYTKQAAETIIQSYKETIEIAKLRKKQQRPDKKTKNDIQNDSAVIKEKPDLPDYSNSKPQVLMFPFGDKTASITIEGGKPSQDEMGLLISILEAFKKTLPIKKDEPKK